jgi:signal transduction histidine kinase/CheY-like chemotaxis protein
MATALTPTRTAALGLVTCGLLCAAAALLTTSAWLAAVTALTAGVCANRVWEGVRNAAQVAAQVRTLQQALNSSDDVVLLVETSGAIGFHSARLLERFPHGPFSGFADFAHVMLDGDTVPLINAVRSSARWTGRLTSKLTPSRIGTEYAHHDPASFDVTVTPTSERSEDGVLVTLRDVSDVVRAEWRQQLSVEGEKVKAAVAWVMSIDAPLSERAFAALASVFQLDGLDAHGTHGAVYLGAPGDTTFPLLTYCGEFPEGCPPTVSAGTTPAGRAIVEGTLVVCDRCTDCGANQPHGHYAMPLMERPGQCAGVVLLFTPENPIRHAQRVEALTLITELFTTAVVRERAAQSLINSSRKAEEASRAKSDFLATMSHEIRTPMNGVLGFTQLLLESGLTAEQREHAQLIYNSGEALLTVINDILDFSKIEAGKLEIEARPTALVSATRETLGLLRNTAERKGVKLELFCDLAVPAGVMLDAMRYRQVLLNLVGNALKFTPRGRVDVSLAVVSGQLEVKVVDEGIGIPAAVLPHLFGKFVQAESSTSRRFGGTGLGLAISKRLVELMGGAIGVTSVEGQGSTFWFRLPIVEAIVERERVPKALPRHRASRKRVLLAEDNLTNQMLARRVLEKMDHDVVVANNGLEAVARMREQHFDVVLMDCQMPELDGFDATREIRTWEASLSRDRTPIIALTANAFADDVERCLASGMDSVMTKPFKLVDLEAALDRIEAPRRLAVVG